MTVVLVDQEMRYRRRGKRIVPSASVDGISRLGDKPQFPPWTLVGQSVAEGILREFVQFVQENPKCGIPNLIVYGRQGVGKRSSLRWLEETLTRGKGENGVAIEFHWLSDGERTESLAEMLKSWSQECTVSGGDIRKIVVLRWNDVDNDGDSAEEIADWMYDSLSNPGLVSLVIIIDDSEDDLEPRLVEFMPKRALRSAWLAPFYPLSDEEVTDVLKKQGFEDALEDSHGFVAAIGNGSPGLGLKKWRTIEEHTNYSMRKKLISFFENLGDQTSSSRRSPIQRAEFLSEVFLLARFISRQGQTRPEEWHLFFLDLVSVILFSVTTQGMKEALAVPDHKVAQSWMERNARENLAILLSRSSIEAGSQVELVWSVLLLRLAYFIEVPIPQNLRS